MNVACPPFDVIIVGAGPAGLFCALELLHTSPQLNVVVLERGSDLNRRICNVSTGGACLHCDPCHMLSGWGGAGAFSDGKLTLTTDFGGSLGDYTAPETLEGLIEYVDEWYRKLGAPDHVYGADREVDRDLMRRAAAADLIYVPARIRHMGTDRCAAVLRSLRERLANRLDVRFDDPVEEILVCEGTVAGVRTRQGLILRAPRVVVAPGRSGSEWVAQQAQRLGIPTLVGPVDVGVRVELPAAVMEDLTAQVFESKLLYYSKSFDDRIRTFCMCPHGEVTLENTDGVVTVNGHSYHNRPTENTNFALLVSKTFTEPFDEPVRYGKNIASLANMLGGGALVQRLGDLMAGRRSTHRRLERGLVTPTLKDATPGDLSLVLPYRHLVGILEMLEALDRLVPGVASRHTLLYGVEVKFYSSILRVSADLQTAVHGLYAAGDGAGITHGLIQASASGVHVARGIVSTMK